MPSQDHRRRPSTSSPIANTSPPPASISPLNPASANAHQPSVASHPCHDPSVPLFSPMGFLSTNFSYPYYYSVVTTTPQCFKSLAAGPHRMTTNLCRYSLFFSSLLFFCRPCLCLQPHRPRLRCLSCTPPTTPQSPQCPKPSPPLQSPSRYAKFLLNPALQPNQQSVATSVREVRFGLVWGSLGQTRNQTDWFGPNWKSNRLRFSKNCQTT
jgi:hypothetical protein